MLTEEASQILKKNSKRGGLALIGALLGFFGNATFVNSYESGYRQALIDIETGKVSKIIYQTDSNDIRIINPKDFDNDKKGSSLN